MPEKTSPLGIKVLTVLFAIGLASGYVLFRNKNSNSTAPPAVGESEKPDKQETANPEADPPESDPVIMSSSKSGEIKMEEMSEEVRRVLMSSSKSGIVIPPRELPELQPEAKQGEGPKPKEPEKPRTILPSSKSMQLIEPQQSEQK